MAPAPAQQVSPAVAEPELRAQAARPAAVVSQAPDDACAICATTLIAGDRFCQSCGHTVSAEAAPAPRAQVDQAIASLAGAERISAPESLLAVRLPFCRACGADNPAGHGACRSCGSSLAPLPARLEGTAGTVYTMRRGLRKRAGVRIGDEGTAAKLLLESGEVVLVEVAELPEPTESPAGDASLPPARTPHGRLVRLAEARERGGSKRKWDAASLVNAALDGIADETVARLVALDLLALGRDDLVHRLPLTASEQGWIDATYAAAAGDRRAVVGAVARLPVAGYRAKLALFALAASEVSPADRPLLEPHVAAYADEEPLAALLHRRLGVAGAEADSPSAAVAEAVTTDRALCETGLLPESLTREAGAVLDRLSGAEPTVPHDVRFLATNARALLAHQAPRPGLVRTEDVDRIPLAVLDDLLESGAVSNEVALGGSTDAQRSTYLRARLAPQWLSDDEVNALEHTAEQARRAFRYGELQRLGELGDSPRLRHYRALLAIRRGKARDVVLEDIHPQARAIAEDLLALLAAKADGSRLSDRLTERMLADPTIWPVLVEIAGSTSLVATPELQTRSPAFTEWLALHQAREYLFVGAWRDAVAAADRCLALAEAEPVRDEALNLKACGLHNLGADDQAIAALEEAIEGDYSDSLLANIGIVAAGLRPEVAARHLGVLIAEAPTTSMRVAAARRALSIWSTSDTASWRNSDDSPLPDVFQDALRALVVADVELDDFRHFASLLAVHDSVWFGSDGNVARSPHRNTLEARFYVARAASLPRMVEIMGQAISAGSPPQWVIYERDSLRTAAIDILFENLDEPDSMFGPVALAMVDHGVLANEADNVLIGCLGVASTTYHLSAHNSEVADHIVGRTQTLRKQWQTLEAERKESLQPLLELATRRVAINRMHARDIEMNDAVDVFNSALSLGRYADIGSPAYAEAMRRIAAAATVARQARQDLGPWLLVLEHEAVIADINQTIEHARDLENRCLKLLN